MTKRIRELKWDRGVLNTGLGSQADDEQLVCASPRGSFVSGQGVHGVPH